jgi:hypothetical protein
MDTGCSLNDIMLFDIMTVWDATTNPADTNSPGEITIKDFYKELINKTFKTV